MMKQNTIKINKAVEHRIEDKTSDNASHSAEEIDATNIYWLAYFDPFMPMIDFTIVFYELKKMIKNVFLKKRKRKNHL